MHSILLISSCVPCITRTFLPLKHALIFCNNSFYTITQDPSHLPSVRHTRSNTILIIVIMNFLIHQPIQCNATNYEPQNNSPMIMQSNLEFIATIEEEAIIKSKERNTISTKTKEEGIFLTWEDLQVTVPNGRNGRKPILKGLTGYAKPGQLLAIMGPSGCGKSTLLDTLAGKCMHIFFFFFFSF